MDVKTTQTHQTMSSTTVPWTMPVSVPSAAIVRVIWMRVNT
jgi:hypothetical protein